MTPTKWSARREASGYRRQLCRGYHQEHGPEPSQGTDAYFCPDERLHLRRARGAGGGNLAHVNEHITNSAPILPRNDILAFFGGTTSLCPIKILTNEDLATKGIYVGRRVSRAAATKGVYKRAEHHARLEHEDEIIGELAIS